MRVAPPSPRVMAYRQCESELGSCYCQRRSQVPCIQPAAQFFAQPTNRGSWSLAVALLGVLLWPLGGLALYLGVTAKRRHPNAIPAELTAATWGAALGGAELFFCFYIAAVIAGSHV